MKKSVLPAHLAATTAASAHLAHGGVHAPIDWPAPLVMNYPAARPLLQAERCEVELRQGMPCSGHLIHFDVVHRQLWLRVLPSQARQVLAFDEIRRLRLLAPILPVLAPPDALPDPFNRDQAAQVYRYEPSDGGPVVEGWTLGHHQADEGVYLFEPIDRSGALRRSFIPATAYTQLRIGKLTGEVLVDEALVTTEQVREALDEQQQLRSQRLGELLVARKVLTQEQLGSAIEAQGRMPMVRIGEALTTLGYITHDQLGAALAEQQADRSVPLGELLLRMGLVTRQDLQTALARKMGFPMVDVVRFPVDAAAVGRLPYMLAVKRLALPLMLHGGRLVVALEDPMQQRTLDEIEFATQTKVVPVLARGNELRGAIDAAYQRVRGTTQQARPLDDGSIALDFVPDDTAALRASLEKRHEQESSFANSTLPEPAAEQSDNSLVRLVNSMLQEAQLQQVSDIHIETQPGQEKLRIRFRKDGRLHPYMELPHTYRGPMVARLKIMCDLDISERRKPQDGKIDLGRFVPGARLELRVVTIPTSNGLEDVVLRLLAATRPLTLDQLGLGRTNLAALKAAAERPHGLFLCVGPTGSGKTTTLHSVLGHLNTPERKIWTAEDPIEISQPGLRQIQVNAKIDWTFAKALRALLRADPDVVMVGEIRDQETARTAIEAALTGHLVLSTLHTNSAPETVTRLLDMGMDPFNFADSLVGVLAQRLVRTLCRRCREPHEASAAELEKLACSYYYLRSPTRSDGSSQVDKLIGSWRRRYGDESGRVTLHRAGGCALCGQTGFAGRAGLHELMSVSRELRQLIQQGARAEELQKLALKQGMFTLRQDGIKKVLGGLTTWDEVRAIAS